MFSSKIYAFDNSIKLYDYAQVFNNNEEKIIKDNLNNFVSKSNSDIVIVSVKFYQFNNVEEYSDAFYTKNNFKTDGVIFIIDLKSKEKYFIKGYGSLKENFTPDVVNKIIDEIKKEDNYFDKSISFINNAYKANDIKSSMMLNNKKKGLLDYFVKYMILSLLIPTIITFVLYIINYYKLKRFNTKNNILKYAYLIDLDITNKEDEFISTNTVSRNIKERIK